MLFDFPFASQFENPLGIVETICKYFIAEQSEINIKESNKESNKVLVD
jgi:hypothetical protein